MHLVQSGMMPNRIKELRNLKGITQQELADLISADTSTVWRWENDRIPPFNDNFLKIAKALGCEDPLELLLPNAEPSSTMVLLVGNVGAGAQVFPLDDGNEYVEGPGGLKNPIALRVTGTSMTPVFREGDILFCEQKTFTPEHLIGNDCIVQIENGPRLVKRVLKGSGPGYFRLFSYETQDVSDDVRIVAGAPVKWVHRARA